MKSVVKHHNGVFFGVGAGDFHGVFHGFRTGIEQRGFLGVVAGCDLGKLFGHRHIGLVGRDHKAGVGEVLHGVGTASTTAGLEAPTVVTPMPEAKSMKAVAVNVNKHAAVGIDNEGWQAGFDGCGYRCFSTPIQFSAFRPWKVLDGAGLGESIREVVHGFDYGPHMN